MGCGSSKDGLANVDDSVHVMIRHDKKRAEQKGEKPQGYVPRAPHPLLDAQKKQQAVTAHEEDSNDGGEAKSNEAGS
jgi:hypothetical protein